MAEQKRHKDVPQERFLERYTHLTAITTVQICEKTQPTPAPAPKHASPRLSTKAQKYP